MLKIKEKRKKNKVTYEAVKYVALKKTKKNTQFLLKKLKCVFIFHMYNNSPIRYLLYVRWRNHDVY